LQTPSLCPPRGNPAHSGSETGSGSCRVAYPCTATQPLHGTDQCGGWEQLALFLQKRELVLRLLPQDTVPLCPPVPPSALGLDGKPRLCRWERVAKSCGSSVSWHGMCVWCSSSWGGCAAFSWGALAACSGPLLDRDCPFLPKAPSAKLWDLLLWRVFPMLHGHQQLLRF
jgi:hypothetical protein